jgi:hypothetical protein
MKLSSPMKLSKSVPSGVTRSLRGEVLTRSPVIQRDKLKAKSTKNDFKKIVQNTNSSDSDKNGDSDCCKECNTRVTKQECDWTKCSVRESGCMKTTQFSPKYDSIVDPTTETTYEIYKEVSRSLMMTHNIDCFI